MKSAVTSSKLGPLAGGFGDDEGDGILSEQLDEGGVAKAFVADFDGVANGAVDVGAG